ncbi:MAG: AmmeMemoRadiSam system protein B [Candidatus Omnitrophica bacterium]|nr:AmmeMemoRadiSam system protein B [Candidatus Omnitrophota bacterium]
MSGRTVKRKGRTGPIREPAVAGIFYAAQENTLRGSLDLLGDAGQVSKGKERVVAVCVPHGGDTASGEVAASVYAQVGRARGAVIIGPRHTQGSSASIVCGGIWRTPLGKLPVFQELAEAIYKEADGILEKDSGGHRDEHSAEVQLPFLQRFVGIHWFVPVVLSDKDPLRVGELGRGIARALRASGENPLLVASVNLSSFEPLEDVRKKDETVIRALLGFDEEGFLKTVQRDAIPVCGVQVAAVVMTAARELGAGRSRLVSYRTSAQQIGFRDSVMGYAGIIWQ